MKKLTVAIVAGLLAFLLLSTGPALAARGGPKGSGGKTAATLSIYQDGVQMSSLAAGSSHEVVGAGLGASKTVYVGLQGYFGLIPVTTDGAGGFSLSQVAPGLPGTYTYIVMVYQHNSWQIAASVTFTVM